MKKLCLCFLALLVCGCHTQTNNCCEVCCAAPQSVCCGYSASPSVVNQSNVRVISSTKTVIIRSGRLVPEIYDPDPLPPLRVYYPRKDKPQQSETAKPVEPAVIKKTEKAPEPQAPHKL